MAAPSQPLHPARRSPVLDALDADSYQWLATQAPDLLTAIELEMGDGRSPDQLQRLVAAHVGPEREALANRVYQAARHILRRQNA